MARATLDVSRNPTGVTFIFDRPPGGTREIREPLRLAPGQPHLYDSPAPSGLGPVSPRRIIEREVERLIAVLDALDGDPDLEDGTDDEPWLGASVVDVDTFSQGVEWLSWPIEDREAEADDEPSEPEVST
jgi:hypothetical protein